MSEPVDVTGVLVEATCGSSRATDRLFRILYDELREAAVHLLRGERRDHTLRATELVHEVYLRLVDHSRCEWENRAHFRAVASRVMRRILVDHARRRGTQKRGGGLVKVLLDESLVIGTEESDAMLLSLEEVLGKLAIQYPESAQVIEMRFFGGLTHEECACVLGVSSRTASRNWEFGRAWLYRALVTDETSG